MTQNNSDSSKEQNAPNSREENPAWLVAAPSGDAPQPPIKDAVNNLPLLGIRWDNFERLCRRLSERSGDVETSWCYGGHGHTQLGIDVLVRMKDGSYEVWQSKRHQTFGAADVSAAVEYFLQHDWAKQAKRFVLALACEISNPKVIDEIEKVRTRLTEKGIGFEALGCSQITEKLREEPEIVDDFFGRPWAEAVCREGAVEILKNRISRFDIDGVRVRLRDFYTAWIAAVDPGLPIAGQDKDGRQFPAPKLAQRYVLPDLLLSVGAIDHETDAPAEQSTPKLDQQAIDSGKPEKSGSAGPARSAPLPTRERVVSVDQLLTTERQAIITADAGAGKTTLLRFLALEILSDQSDVAAIHDRYAGFVPVWVPFALWTRMAEEKSSPPPLEDVVHAFIAAQSDVALADEMKRVLSSQKIVLLVDGIDEARNEAASDSVLAGLTAFAERRNVPVFATSRPHGMRALNGIGGNWTRLRLAPLSERQRNALALLWYRILERSELGPSAAPEAVEAEAQRRATGFIEALARSPGITRLSQTPLFLIALLKLHRLGHDLPRNRFDASKEIVAQLVEHQPRRRAKDAVDTLKPTLDRRDRDRLLDDFAYGLHAGELRGAVADGAIGAEAISRAAALILARNGSADLAAAEAQARTVFSFSEESAGLLVKKAHDNIGFLHRSLQEYFVARKLLQLPFSEKLSFVRDHAPVAIWSEPILNLLFLVTIEQEVGQLLEAIERAPVTDAAGTAVRDALLTEAVFADFSHDLAAARRLADKLFRETELFAWGSREQQLLSAITDGLFSQSLSTKCAEKLQEWLPDRHGYGRASAILAMPKWDNSLRPACLPILLRAIASETQYLWKSAAVVLAELSNRSQEAKASLLELLHRPRSIDTLNASLFALGRGWSGDADVGAIALALRSSENTVIQTDAMRIRAERGEADLTDLEIFAPIAFGPDRFSGEMFAPDLTEYFAKNHKAELTWHLEEAIKRASRRNNQTSLVASLIIVDPAHPLVTPTLMEILSADYAFGELFARSNFPVNRVIWNPDLIRLVEARVANDRYFEHETYWISKVLPLPSVKSKMLSSLKDRDGLAFWSARGLAEGWGKNDREVSDSFQALLSASSSKVAQVAAELPLIVDDKEACRAAILHALRDKPKRADFLIAGIKTLAPSDDDEEVFKACYEAGSLTKNSLYDDMWRSKLIQAFPMRPEVRALALMELDRRDGNVGAVSHSYSADTNICSRVLWTIGPLPAAARMTLVTHLETAASSSERAFNLLEKARDDTDGTVCGEAVVGWVEACLAGNRRFDEEKHDYLISELHAAGPQFENRRAAAVVGLGLTGKLTAFAELRDRQGKAETVNLGHVAIRDNDDRYLRRILPQWERFSAALGGDAEVVRRLELSAETCLGILNPGVQNADKLLKLLEAQIPTALHVQKHDHISALARFAPDGAAMRDLIMPLLVESSDQRMANIDMWSGMKAAEIFAEHFSNSAGLLRQVIDSFILDPTSDFPAAALAEVFLKKPGPELGDLLAAKAADVDYSIVTTFKLLAAIGTSERIVNALLFLMRQNPRETAFWNCSYWVPSLLRRIELDEDVADKLIEAVATGPSASARISLLALVGRSNKGRTKFRSMILQHTESIAKEIAPVLGFDVTSGSERLAQHVFYELLA
jgi:hypothetical protein